MAAAERPSVLPFLVGVTGKLELRGREQHVRTAFRSLFDRLDRLCPSTEMVLLSGLAKGADTIAATEALDRPGWRVVAVLPLGLPLFREDFPAELLPQLERLLKHPRVRTRTLRPLRASAEGPPLEPAKLHRSSVDAPNLLRRDHYEQLGLFLAKTSGLLIALVDEKRPAGKDKLGGTHRVVRHRLEGPDRESMNLIRRSDELRDDDPLDWTCGAVWQIDLEALDPETEGFLTARGPGTTAGDGEGETALAGAAWIERFNRQARNLPEPAWKTIEAASPSPLTDPCHMLRRCRLVLSTIQRRMMNHVRRVIGLLALLFCLAVASYEAFIELGAYPWSRWMIWAYVIAAVTGVLAYRHATRRGWQTLAEEYRALSEALRVQLVWWRAGLTRRADRVDQHILCGFDSTLAGLRHALRQTLDASLLLFGEPKPQPDAASAWIAEQIGFFTSRGGERRRAVERIEAISWFLFAASLGAAATVAAVQTPLGHRLVALAAGDWSGKPLILLLTLAAVAALFAASLWSRWFADPHGDKPVSKTRRTTGTASAVAAGVTLCASAAVLAGLLPGPGHGHGDSAGEFAPELAQELMAVLVVLPAAIAGALRFVGEKLSLVTEVRAYQESLARYSRGRDALASGWAEGQEEEIVRSLGREALQENEAWLHAHRERPLEPVVGG